MDSRKAYQVQNDRHMKAWKARLERLKAAAISDLGGTRPVGRAEFADLDKKWGHAEHGTEELRELNRNYPGNNIEYMEKAWIDLKFNLDALNKKTKNWLN